MFSLGPASVKSQRVTQLLKRSSILKARPPVHSPSYPVLSPRHKTWLYSMCFDEFMTHSCKDFMGRNRKMMLLCPIRAIRHYLSRTEQCHPACSNFFISLGKKKEMLFREYYIISLWLRLVVK